MLISFFYKKVIDLLKKKTKKIEDNIAIQLQFLTFAIRKKIGIK